VWWPIGGKERRLDGKGWGGLDMALKGMECG